MRQIGTVPTEEQAQRLVDYLLTLGITSRVDRTASGCVIWVHREDRVEEGKAELAAFLQAPEDEKYRAAEGSARGLRREAERREREHAKNTINLRGRRSYRPFERCRLTYLLIISSIAVTLYTDFGTNEMRMKPLYIAHYSVLRAGRPNQELRRFYVTDLERTQILSNAMNDLRKGEIWRLVTPIFLHFAPFHLLFNMLVLYDLGGLIEMRKGTLKFGLLVFVAAAISNLGQYYFRHMPIFGGMSGVDYALFGYVWMKSEYDPASGMRLRKDTIALMLGWLVLCMFGSQIAWIGDVANTAHVVGLVVGIAAGIAPHLLQTYRR